LRIKSFKRGWLIRSGRELLIIIKIGQLVQVFWGIIALVGIVLISSGLLNAINSLTEFGNITLANQAALSHISGSIVISILGLGVAAAGYLGIRGKIIFVRN
jgi:hypothetical protein